jgi:hypothetical protein
VDKRMREKALERQQRREQEVRKIEQQALDQAQWDAWFERKLNATLADKEKCVLIESVGQVIGETSAKLRKDYEAKIAVLETRLKDLEHQAALNQQFLELERRLDARQLARDEARRGPEISQGELLEKFEALQRQVDELKSVADLNARFRELAERLSELEKTNCLEVRFTKFADEVKRGSELPQSELLARIVELERRFDDLKKIANQPGPQGPPGPPGKLPLVREYVSATWSRMLARCGRRSVTLSMGLRTPIGSASRALVVMVAMGDHRTSAAHTMRVKSTSGSTSLRSMAPPSSLVVTIRASALATVGRR